MNARKQLAELGLAIALIALVAGLYVGVVWLVPIDFTPPRIP
jgi:hypothetical protein